MNTRVSVIARRTALLSAILASAAFAQGFTAADSGWVRLFNGVNFDGLYGRMYGQEITRPPAGTFQIADPGTDTAMIQVVNTGGGHVGTDRADYSHYRVRVQYRFSQVNNNHNAGLTYHTDETVPRMQNNWPRSIESQMKQNETGSAFSIQQLAFTTRTSATGAGSNYVPTGGTVVNACEFGCNGRWYRGNPFIPTSAGGVSRWMQKMVIARGADSAIHVINDTVVFRLWNLRIVNNSGQLIAPHDRGAIAVQAEGAPISYRRWEIMEFPASTPMNAHYLHRLFLDSPATVMMMPQNPGSISFQWRGIGTIPWVRIERNTGGNGWMPVADTLPNTGSHTWNHQGTGTICASPACAMTHFRILGPDFVWGDSTVGRTTSIGSVNASFRDPLLRARGGQVILPAGFDRAVVRDAAGRHVRALDLAATGARWDLAADDGSRVRPGLYFLRLTGALNEPRARDARVLVTELQ
jgi:hypothetical protein